MVTAKKHFGQHFLKDENKAREIVNALKPDHRYDVVIEIGPGMGILSQFLFQQPYKTYLAEIDKESVKYLEKKFPQYADRIIEGDFLKLDFKNFKPQTKSSSHAQQSEESAHSNVRLQTAIIGNFPYNISSQILFKVLENKEQIPEVVGMFQKEVAERIAAPPGSKTYGILSVLMQTWYEVELLMTLNENEFSPAPKVKSAVLRFERKENFQLRCEEKLFFKVVKTAFNQRRKTLRNALKTFVLSRSDIPYLDKRAENLSWQQFEELTLLFQNPLG